MIRPPGFNGAVFSEQSDGDIRNDTSARAVMARQLGLSDEWAVVKQIHGNRVLRVALAGDAGEADGLWTAEPELPLAIFTADCFGVVLISDKAVGVAHAGWRGAGAGIVTRLRDEMTIAGHVPTRAVVGPGIGPCCFEVGLEVAAEFGDEVSTTTWGTTSVDLPAVIAGQLDGLKTWSVAACTRHEDGWFSHRRDGTTKRLATVAWLT